MYGASERYLIITKLKNGDSGTNYYAHSMYVVAERGVKYKPRYKQFKRSLWTCDMS